MSNRVFKLPDGSSATQRIPMDCVAPTLKTAEAILGCSLSNWAGSTGIKPVSGDIDVIVDSSQYDRREVANLFRQWAIETGQDPKQCVAMSGITVHVKLPMLDVMGDPVVDNGNQLYAQVDIMFGDPRLLQWCMRGEPSARYKGKHRNIIISSIAKSRGLKMSQTRGLCDRVTGDVIETDPVKIAPLLLDGCSLDDLLTVDRIISFLQKNYTRRDIENMLSDSIETLMACGVEIDLDSTDVNPEDYHVARLRDRVIENGMDALIESAINGSTRIAHPEDLVFSHGSRGIQLALEALQSVVAKKQPVTIKWDGKPAIIFGRNERGEFILTDKAGFTAKKYDGKAKNIDDIKRMMSQRRGDRRELIAMYDALFPLLSSIIPKTFRGYVFGDLLYVGKPPVKQNNVVFSPNTVTYRVSANTTTGKRILASDAGVAVHTYIGLDGSKKSIGSVIKNISEKPSVVLFRPDLPNETNLRMPANEVSRAKSILSLAGEIDRLLNRDALRSLQISDFPALLQRFFNSKVSEGKFDNLGAGFLKWLPAFTTRGKAERIEKYVRDNRDGYVAVLKSFLLVTAVKEQIINQLNQQVSMVDANIGGKSGHEGFVIGNGDLKLVSRLRFSRANFAMNS